MPRVPDFCALWRALNALAGDRWRRSSRWSAVTPDSPVYTGQFGVHRTCPMNYSGAAEVNSRGCRVRSHDLLEHRTLSGVHRTVRWIIARQLPRIPEGEEFEVDLPWCTGHCPVVHRTVRCARPGCLRLALCSFVWTLFLGLFIGLWWTFVPVELINLGKLVSPIICVG
jgi:hypothetical protein